jgi:hypothetical protein
MRGLQSRHMLLALGAALLVAGIFVPWIMPVVYYNSSDATLINWSPFDFLWNAMWPHVPAVNAYIIGLTENLVGVSALYLIAASIIAVFAYPLIRRDMRQVDTTPMAWWLLASAGLAGFMALLGWVIIPYLVDGFSDSAAVDLRSDLGAYGGPIAFAGAALAFVGLFDIAMNSYNRRLRTSGRMLAAGEDSAPAAIDA